MGGALGSFTHHFWVEEPHFSKVVQAAHNISIDKHWFVIWINVETVCHHFRRNCNTILIVLKIYLWRLRRSNTPYLSLLSTLHPPPIKKSWLLSWRGNAYEYGWNEYSKCKRTNLFLKNEYSNIRIFVHFDV